MLTKNAKKLLSAAFLSRETQSTIANIPIVDENGDTINSVIWPGNTWPTNTEYYKFRTGNAVDGICIGSGTTTPTDDDYCMESKITGVTGRVVTNAPIGGLTSVRPMMIYVIVKNTTDNAITISEVGCFAHTFHYDGSGISLIFHPIMLDHSLLDTPVTIPAGETGLIIYTITGTSV